MGGIPNDLTAIVTGLLWLAVASCTEGRPALSQPRPGCQPTYSRDTTDAATGLRFHVRETGCDPWTPETIGEVVVSSPAGGDPIESPYTLFRFTPISGEHATVRVDGKTIVISVEQLSTVSHEVSIWGDYRVEYQIGKAVSRPSPVPEPPPWRPAQVDSACQVTDDRSIGTVPAGPDISYREIGCDVFGGWLIGELYLSQQGSKDRTLVMQFEPASGLEVSGRFEAGALVLMVNRVVGVTFEAPSWNGERLRFKIAKLIAF